MNLIKKSITFLMAFGSLAMIGCGNKDNEFAKYMVNEEEFFAAIQFEGASYLQKSRDPSSSYRIIDSYSLNAHSEATYVIQDAKIGSEIRIFKDGNSYSRYRLLQGVWDGPTDASEGEFETIQQVGKRFIKNLENLQIGKYEDYKFIPEKKAYHADIPPTSNDGDGIAYELFFEDKKMIASEKILKESSNHYTYTYDEIIIRKPEVPSNLK